MSYDESSDNEAPMEVTFSQAKQSDSMLKRSGAAQGRKKVQKKEKVPKKTKKELDPKIKAMLESGWDDDADRELELRKAKMERIERPSQMININPSSHQIEQKISKNLKVICLKKIPVITKNTKYLDTTRSILERPGLNRRPLKVNK